MKVIKVRKEDTGIINFIIENLIPKAAEKPSGSHINKLLTDDSAYLLAAILHDQVIGYALAYRFPSLYTETYLAYLYDIEVLAIYRRKGAGRLLITTMLACLKTNGVSELWLGTATDNIEAQALFNATGGIKSGETFNDFTYELNAYN